MSTSTVPHVFAPCNQNVTTACAPDAGEADLAAVHRPNHLGAAIEAHAMASESLRGAAVSLAELIGALRSGNTDDIRVVVEDVLEAVGEANGHHGLLAAYLAKLGREAGMSCEVDGRTGQVVEVGGARS